MKENKYDEQSFFEKYALMQRSQKGLAGAGEWHELKKLLPSFEGKRVLDLGCGYGWHCEYAAANGAAYVLGTDISEKMLEEAKKRTKHSTVEYRRAAMEELAFPSNSFDVALSSLAFHYVQLFDSICKAVANALVSDGEFIFSVEHPIFTAYGTEDWYYDNAGNKLHWPVDAYFTEGPRETTFLGETVLKYHRTLTTYVATLLENGFMITGLTEPASETKMIEKNPEYEDELRRPMMLIFSAKKA